MLHVLLPFFVVFFFPNKPVAVPLLLFAVWCGKEMLPLAYENFQTCAGSQRKKVREAFESRYVRLLVKQA